MRTANAIAKQGKLAEARAYLHGLNVQGEPQRVQLLVAESQLLRDANLNNEAFDLLGQALRKTPDEPDLLYDMRSPRKSSIASMSSNRASSG